MSSNANNTSQRWVYEFGGGKVDGDATMRDLLGGKGANLAEMAKLNLPVPPGFTVSTEVCSYYYQNDRRLPDNLGGQIKEALSKLENKTGKRFGDTKNPLLVSVRSGSRASMPGMMDTVLNLGLNSTTVEGLASKANARFAYDSYRRFIQMYSNVVLGMEHDTFEYILDDYKQREDYQFDTDLKASDWKAIVDEYKNAVEESLEKPFPEAPHDQLQGAVKAVINSWMNDRAILYRKLNDIPEEWGTAVNIQAMVFGNMGDTSATGVAFTRNPSTGEDIFYGEYLINAQGEDVVAGIRTPAPVSNAHGQALQSDEDTLEKTMPVVFRQLIELAKVLEKHYRDMQDIEFTIEDGELFILQTRNGKRTAAAALKIAVDLANAGTISNNEAVLRIDPSQLDQLLHPTISQDAVRQVIVKGLPASPGAAVGKVVFDSKKAAQLAEHGEDVILMRAETSPEDIHGMHAARAIVTARGGMTSHAAVVARGMGRPCVCGAGQLVIDAVSGEFKVGGRTYKEGDNVTVDGTTGEVLAGEVKMNHPNLSGDFEMLMGWADEVSSMLVRCNAETPVDVQTAKDFGAQGIGLCRTEHMFFDMDRISTVRTMILAEDEAGRRAALEELMPVQRSDFEKIFEIMREKPCTIRLLDPPLHEFLPQSGEDITNIANSLGIDEIKLRHRINELDESNPMLGFRGCRLGIAFPEIYEMQSEAIFEAAVNVVKNLDCLPSPEVMIPLVATKEEFEILKNVVDRVAEKVFDRHNQKIDYLVGTMIELPRAALRAGDIARSAQFFSFGTNDLTQTTLGISRDDAGKFLKTYETAKIYKKDPFTSIDIEGVGELVRLATERGRQTRPEIKLGICGEHGGDPASIKFCHKLGLDYVSCSPYRIPIARLSAAHASLN